MDTPLLMVLLSVISGFVLALTLGHFLIPALRALKAGQSIREVGPKWHNGKKGTPTMGGLMFIIGIAVAVLVVALTGRFAAFSLFSENDVLAGQEKIIKVK